MSGVQRSRFSSRTMAWKSALRSPSLPRWMRSLSPASSRRHSSSTSTALGPAALGLVGALGLACAMQLDAERRLELLQACSRRSRRSSAATRSRSGPSPSSASTRSGCWWCRAGAALGRRSIRCRRGLDRGGCASALLTASTRSRWLRVLRVDRLAQLPQRLQAVAGRHDGVRIEPEVVEAVKSTLTRILARLSVVAVDVDMQEADFADVLLLRLLGQMRIGGAVQQVVEVGVAVMLFDEAADIRLRLGHHAGKALPGWWNSSQGGSCRRLSVSMAGAALTLSCGGALCRLAFIAKVPFVVGGSFRDPAPSKPANLGWGFPCAV